MTCSRRFVPPFGRLTRWRFVIVQPADPQPLVSFNRYPRQIIGIGLRLPDGYGLSIMWAKPARWWK